MLTRAMPMLAPPLGWPRLPAAAAADRASSRRESAYYVGFLMSLLLCWCPYKAAAYAAPALCIAWVILAGRSVATFRRVMATGLVAGGVIVGHLLLNDVFVLSSALVAVATYSGMTVLWVFPGRDLRSPRLLSRMTDATCIMLMLQCVVGYVQAIYGYLAAGTFDGANGDIVQGTIYPFLRGDGAFANPMYSASVALMTLSLMPGARVRKKYALAVSMGAVALVLASVLHQLTFLALALGLAYLWSRPRLRLSRAAVILGTFIVLTVLLSVALLPGNLATFRSIVAEFLAGHSPRRTIVERVIHDMPASYPYMPLVGVGPGQFSSRAALMNTGFYFGTPLAPKDFSPFLQNAIPEPMRESLLPLWIRNTGMKYYGSSQKPYFTWLSVYTEFGGIGLLMVLGAIGVALWRLPRRAKDLQLGLLSFSSAAMILFVALIAFQENYWEVPQAVLPGLLLARTIYAQATGRQARMGDKRA
ncbi:MAG: hypothetical protein ACE141_12845 [Bryobacteraceae bacterium]